MDIKKRYQWCKLRVVKSLPYMCRRCRRNLFSIFWPTTIKNIQTNGFAYVPIHYCQCAIDRNGHTLFCDASRYAVVYLELSDSLDFGKSQELAATVNNEFHYHLDQKNEQKLKNEKKKYKNTLVFVALAAILMASIAYILV